MDEFASLGREDGDQMFKEFSTRFDAPAYIRRARQVQEAYDVLLGRCRRQREEWLKMVRIRLALLRALAGDWPALTSWLSDAAQLQALQQLHADLAPQLRHRVEPTTSVRVLRRALRELKDSIELFNRRWQGFLPSVDVGRVNELREGYNRYYLLEKECVIRSARVARLGFRPLEPLTVAELLAVLPLLPVPQLRE